MLEQNLFAAAAGNGITTGDQSVCRWNEAAHGIFHECAAVAEVIKLRTSTGDYDHMLCMIRRVPTNDVMRCVLCPALQVMVGFCGSGANLDCSGYTSSTRIKCCSYY